MDSMSEADDICVLDTGSTDDTVERLKARGAHVEQKIIAPWRFDVARNKSLKLIPKDADICCCIDLDEQFQPGWREKLERAWQPDTTRARYRYTWSFLPDGREGCVFWTDKIHKNGCYRWVNPVHEVLQYLGEGGERFVDAEGVQLDHHPDPSKSRGQYLPLLELAVREDPQNDRNRHYLGREYMFRGEWAQAVSTLKAHLAMPQAVWRDERCASMRYIARCLRRLEREDEAALWLHRAIAEYLRAVRVEQLPLRSAEHRVLSPFAVGKRAEKRGKSVCACTGRCAFAGKLRTAQGENSERKPYLMAFFGFQLLFLPPYDRLLEIINRGGAAMELCERYLHYMSALCEGTMPAPPELALIADTTEERAAQLQSALNDLSVPDFVRLCAKSAGDELDEAIFDHFSEEDFSRALLQMLTAAAEPEEVEEQPPAAESTPDPDAGKHAFEVFCDCVELDEQLVAYLIDILKRGDKAAFYKLSQVTTQLDLDPREFLYWLAHREDYGTDDERACAAIMDACFARLYEEKQGELLGALLSGDRKTFELFRTEAPELRHLPAATYEWYSKNYLDRDYPLRFILMCNGVEFPDTPEEDK